jgi:periplasmic divalent cation tolerance protein
MKKAGYAVIMVTVSSREEADKITAVLLENRRAACVNIVPGISSHFWWHNSIDQADELLLVIKTRLSIVPEVIKLVKKHHSYSVPEIIALPIVAGNDDYLNWIGAEVPE